MSLKVKDIKMMIMISRLGASRRSSASQTTMMRRVRMRMVLTMAGAYGPTLLTSSTQPKEPTLSNRLNRNLPLRRQNHPSLRTPRAKLKLKRQQSMLNLSQNQLKHSKKRRKSPPHHRLKSRKATIWSNGRPYLDPRENAWPRSRSPGSTSQTWWLMRLVWPLFVRKRTRALSWLSNLRTNRMRVYSTLSIKNSKLWAKLTGKFSRRTSSKNPPGHCHRIIKLTTMINKRESLSKSWFNTEILKQTNSCKWSLTKPSRNELRPLKKQLLKSESWRSRLGPSVSKNANNIERM